MASIHFRRQHKRKVYWTYTEIFLRVRLLLAMSNSQGGAEHPRCLGLKFQSSIGDLSELEDSAVDRRFYKVVNRNRRQRKLFILVLSLIARLLSSFIEPITLF